MNKKKPAKPKQQRKLPRANKIPDVKVKSTVIHSRKV